MEIRFKLYSRDYCHLCHDLLAALEAMQDECGLEFAIEVIDVDADATDSALLELYDEKVPVLAAVTEDGERELCHYFLDRPAVLAHLQSLRREHAEHVEPAGLRS